jgi:hypothetical protein
MALMRLVQSGKVERIGRGLYALPKESRFGIKSMPAAEKVAQAIASSEGAVLGMHGAEAARRFGLTTQMPTQSVFYTSGSPRQIRYGKSIIRLVHAAPRKLLLAGRPAGQALSALWYLGVNQVASSTFKRIAEQLSVVEFQALQQVKSSMPAWMAEAMNRYERGEALRE